MTAFQIREMAPADVDAAVDLALAQGVAQQTGFLRPDACAREHASPSLACLVAESSPPGWPRSALPSAGWVP